MRRAVTVAVPLGALLALPVLDLQRLVGVDGWGLMGWFGVWVAAALVGAVAQGVLMGEHRFGAVAVSLLLGGGIGRLLLGVLLSAELRSASAAMAATALAQVVTTVLLVVALRPRLGSSRDLAAEVTPRLRHGLLSTAALTGLALLTGVDTLLGQQVLDHRHAGLYAAAGVVARMTLFVAAPIAALAFPRFVAARRDPDAIRSVLLISLGCAVAVSGIGVLVLEGGAGLVVRLVLGADYAGSAPLVRTLALEGAALGFLMLLVNFHLARESAWALVAWPVALGEVAVALALRPSPSGLAVIGSSAACLAVAIAWPAAFVQLRRARVVVLPETAVAVPPVPRGEVELSIVVPFFNAGPALRPHIQELVEVLQSAGCTFEVIAVADGCTDGCERTLEGLAPDHVRVMVNDRNTGKGHALRTGLAVARGQYVGFVDGDGDLPAELLRHFVAESRTRHPDIAVGSKRHPESVVSASPLRRVYSLGYQLLVRVLFRLPVRDTQTGLKIVRRDVLLAVLPRMLEKRFAFDLELLVAAKRAGFGDQVELPITIRPRLSSTISRRAVYLVLQDTFAIFYRLRIRRWYDAPHRPVPAVLPQPDRAVQDTELVTPG
jgi:hypothetical protein